MGYQMLLALSSRRHRPRQPSLLLPPGTLYASRYRVGLQGKPCAHQLRSNGTRSTTRRSVVMRCSSNTIGTVSRAREEALRGPTHATRHCKNNAEDTDRHAGKKTANIKVSRKPKQAATRLMPAFRSQLGPEGSALPVHR